MASRQQALGFGRIVMAAGLMGAALAPAAQAVTFPPTWCDIAGRAQSNFARMNLAEQQTFEASRSDFRFRLVQYDTQATGPTVPPALPNAAQAYQQCIDGLDSLGQPALDPTGAAYGAAKLLFEATSFTRPAWIAAALAHPEIQFLVYRGAAPAMLFPQNNAHWYLPQEYRGWYAKGVVAGLATRSNTVGLLMNFDGPAAGQAAPVQDATNANAFLLGARSVNPAVQVVTVANQTFAATVQPPNNPWPGFSSTTPWAIPTYLNCRATQQTPAGPLTGQDIFDPAKNPDATADPVTGRLRNGPPIDCLAIDKLMAAWPAIDVLAGIRASFLPQVYTLTASGNPSPPLFIESAMSDTMAAGDITGFLGDPRVLTASVFDFQAFLHQAADRFLGGQLASDPVQQVLPQRIPGYSQGVSGVDIARLSELLSAVQRAHIKANTVEVLLGVRDPLCGTLAMQYLGSGSGAGYGFDAGGCMDPNERYTGIPGVANPAPLAPQFAAHLRCIPVAAADPVTQYPWRCAP